VSGTYLVLDFDGTILDTEEPESFFGHTARPLAGAQSLSIVWLCIASVSSDDPW
jgi:hypothetical protein